MKFSKSSQLFLVSAIGLLVAALLSACAITTIDYVFVASSAASAASGNGEIDTYAVDSQSGALRPVDEAVSTGGAGPVAMAVSSDYANLYVANKGNSTVVHFSIASSGVLTQKDSVTVGGIPAALAVNTAGTWLYVVYSNASSVPAVSASLVAYPLSSGTIGAASTPVPLAVPGFTTDFMVPTGITVLADNSTVQGNALFITAYDRSAYNPGGTPTSNANPGWVFGFTIGSGGALTASTGSPWQAGIKPSALASDPTDRFVYVTDFASSQLIAYTILDGSTLNFLPNGPFKTGAEPSAIVVDPRGKFIYVANALDSTVSPYAITLATGSPTAVLGTHSSPYGGTDPEPVALTIDPALGRYLYAACLQGNSISGFRIDPIAGTMSITQSTPYPTGSEPTAVVSIPHGNTAVQTVTP
jgi:6-phosphogluconolactonase (cycloisomerase 2 family)